MRLLVVGGTSFVGRHAVEHAVEAGHDVTVFHRGRTNDDLLAGRIEHRHGDRTTGDYASLDTDETWDAVIDVSAYFPRAVEQLADVLDGRAGHCVHISSISAYDDAAITPDEDSPLYADLADPTEEAVTGETYGPLKAMCERAAVQRFGAAHTTVIRPTYVIGPWDKTDRFTYWVRRMERGGDVAVVFPDAPLQVIDGRDLGTFMVRCAVDATPGAFDGVGPLRAAVGDAGPARAGGRRPSPRRRRRRRRSTAAGVVLPLLSPEEAARGVPGPTGHRRSRRRPHHAPARRHRRRPARLGRRPRHARPSSSAPPADEERALLA